MKKSFIAIAFTALFMGVIALPSFSLLDSDLEVLVMIDFNEEEEKENSESKLDMKLKVGENRYDPAHTYAASDPSNIGFYQNRYSTEVLDLISPPPEHRF